MNVESFLAYWSVHNTQIIEVLIGLILLMVVYLAFRSFFGEEGSAFADGAAAPALDAAQLEKTLQKILENQAPHATVSDAAAAAEVERLKGEVTQRDATIEELKKNLSSTSSATLGGGSANEEEKKKSDEKIKDLEARLSEYEIISEDIADLSFYKEENAKLQRELEALRNAVPAAPPQPLPAEVISDLVEATLATPSADPMADILAAAAPAPAAPPAPTTAAAPVPVSEAVPAASAPTEAAAAETPASPTVASNAPAKPAETSATQVVASEAAPAAEERPATAEESQLMNQFENFVKKG